MKAERLGQGIEELREERGDGFAACLQSATCRWLLCRASNVTAGRACLLGQAVTVKLPSPYIASIPMPHTVAHSKERMVAGSSGWASDHHKPPPAHPRILPITCSIVTKPMKPRLMISTITCTITATPKTNPRHHCVAVTLRRGHVEHISASACRLFRV